MPTGPSRLEGVLPDAPTSTKRYKISCFDDGSGKPASMRLRVQGMPPSAGSLVSATLERNGESCTIIDTTNGNLVYSDYASLDQGLGEYILTVRKVKKSATAPDSSLKGATPFKTAQECNTANGAYTGISMPEEIPGNSPPLNLNPTPTPGPTGPVFSSKLLSFSLHQAGRGVVSEIQCLDQLEYLFCCDTFNGGFRRIAKNRRFEVLLAALLVSWIGSANALRHQAQISVYAQNHPVWTYPSRGLSKSAKWRYRKYLYQYRHLDR